jgi:hypothetical protein
MQNSHQQSASEQPRATFGRVGGLKGMGFLFVAVLLIATFALYSGSLDFPLVYDDTVFFDNPELVAKYAHAFFSLDLRWISYATFSLTTGWVGADIFWLRAENVFLHAANAIALLFLLRKLFVETLQENQRDTAGRSAWLAFLGALIFAFHPVAVYGTAYLIQRSILMANLFVLLMLLAYLEGLLRGHWQWMVAAALCYFAAVYSKEHSVTAPGLALALTFLVRKPSLALARQVFPYYILSTLIALTLMLSIKGIVGYAYEPNAAGLLEIAARKQGLASLPNSLLLSIVTQSTLFFKYLGLWVVPNPGWMSVDMREPFASSVLSWPYAFGMASFIVYPCVAVWLLQKRGARGLLGFALLCPWIMFLTELSTVRMQEPFVLYRSYLWMPGLFAALPFVLSRVPTKQTVLLLAMIWLALIPLTLNRLNTFSSVLALWDDAERLVRPQHNVLGAELIYYNHGTELGKLKHYREAVDEFSRAIAILPLDIFFGNRATAYFFLGEYDNALRDFNRAIELNPDNPNSYYGRAMTYRTLGDFSAAQDDLRKSCAMGLCTPGG